MSARNLRLALVGNCEIHDSATSAEFLRILRLALNDEERFCDFEVDAIVDVLEHQINKALRHEPDAFDIAFAEGEPLALNSDDLCSAYDRAEVGVGGRCSDIINEIRALIAEALA